MQLGDCNKPAPRFHKNLGPILYRVFTGKLSRPKTAQNWAFLSKLAIATVSKDDGRMISVAELKDSYPGVGRDH